MNQSVQNLLKIIGLLIVIPVIALLVGSIISYIMPSGFSNIVAVGAGILTGVLCCLAFKLLQTPNVILGTIICVLAGVAVFCIHVQGTYNTFVKQVYIESGMNPNVDPQQLTDRLLKEETGYSGVWGYLVHLSKVGILIKSTRSSVVTEHKGFSFWFEMIANLTFYA